MSTYIAYKNKKGFIKSVEYHGDGSLDELGTTLYEYFKDLSDVKTIVKTTVDYIDEDTVHFFDEETSEFMEYENTLDFIEDIDGCSFYYLFLDDAWHVSKPNFYEFKLLEEVLEEEF